ncbi:MAG: peptide chain release factor N(5)-glutamine methyltransferase [Alphaproteobacteria bacterium]|nr:peptide chain release factor N(5)-glutamine methyltransferase [Alphaproteobacteria bacterium]
MTFEELKKLLSFSESASTEAKWIMSENLSDSETYKVIERRKFGEPLSKILGHRGFWQGDFIVDKNVLDPRPDSETLIQSVLEKFPDKNQSLRILDLGTGSGCLLISLLMEYPKATGIGVDISEKALKIAKKNTLKNDVKAEFILADMTKLPQNLGTFDIIISNPPYIPTKDIEGLDENVKKFDPLLALDGGEDGLDFYRIIAKIAPAPIVFLEIGQDQEKDVQAIFEKQNWEFLDSKKDYAGITRVLIFKKDL